jgi:hypothetical protein
MILEKSSAIFLIGSPGIGWAVGLFVKIRHVRIKPRMTLVNGCIYPAKQPKPLLRI